MNASIPFPPRRGKCAIGFDRLKIAAGRSVPILGLFCALCAWVFCSNQGQAAPGVTNESAIQLTIDLRDGSRVVGKSLEDTLSLHSALLGDMKLAWARIRSIECAAGADMARLTAANGDGFAMQFAVQSLGVDTSFGKTELPVKLIRSIKVAGGLSSGGLIGRWKLDDGNGTVAKDSSPNHHDGRLGSGGGGMGQSIIIQKGGPMPDVLPGNRFDNGGWRMPVAAGAAGSLPVWTQGRNGGALQFNGAGQYVSLGNILEDGYAELSIACWVKHPRSGWQHIVERSTWDNLDGIGLMMDYSGASVDFGHYGQQVMSRTVVQDDQWHHVVGTLSRDGADYVYSIFVDGKWDNAVTNSLGFIPSSNGWGIGARYNGSWNYQGLIEDVRIYDRALKEDEVKQIYEARD